MFNIIKTVIESNHYELADILKKIDKVWLEGKLTDEERTMLVEQAQGGANPQNSIDVFRKLEEMDKRIAEIENKLKGDVETETETELPAYEVGKWYYAGDKVTFEGLQYECIAPDGVPCVWSPKDYPAYWEEYNPTELI